PEGGTAETVFAFQCDGETISALDIVVLVNEGPSITDFEYTNGKFVLECESGDMNIDWVSPQTDDITVSCDAFTSDQGLTFEPGTGDAGQWSETISPALAGTTYTSSPSFTLMNAGTHWVYCDITNTSGQSTQFQTFLHVNTPAVGHCTEDRDDNGIDEVYA